MVKETKIAIVNDVHIAERNHPCRKDNFMETAVNKLDYIATNNDYVILAGDLFHVASNSLNVLYVMYTLMMKHRGKFIGIYGNHDIFNRNMSLNNKTTVGILKLVGAYDVKYREEFDVAGIKFYAVDVEQECDTIPIDTDNEKVLIGHKYYNQPDKTYESLSSEDIRRLNYNMVFLGHDHKPYDESFVGKSVIVRMGSLTRIDTQEYNKDRDIVYYQLVTTGDGQFEYGAKVVPHKPAKECYTEEGYAKLLRHEEEKEYVSYIQIGDALARLTKKSTGSNSLDKVLKRIGTPQSSIDEIKWRHELNNVTYT